MDAGAIGIKVGFEVLKRTTPTTIEWLRTYVGGIKMLILGPGGAGKTSIADYMQYGILEEHQPHEKTLELQKSKVFKITIGRDEALKLRIRRAVDAPGQTGPVEHANLVRDQRPHAILIVLDGATPAKNFSDWIDPFCERLDYVLRQDKRLANKVRGVFVALNKRDLIRTDQVFQARRNAVKKGLSNGLNEILGRQITKSIPVLPTIAIQSSKGTTMLDALIRRIAKKVAQ